MIRLLRLTLFLFWVGGFPVRVLAEDLPVFKLTLENHLFFPSRLAVPADTKFKLLIENRDDSPEEFDSFDLNREKVIFPGRSSRVFVGPLPPGTYEFFGEFNSSTARGVVVAVPKDRFDLNEGSRHAD